MNNWSMDAWVSLTFASLLIPAGVLFVMFHERLDARIERKRRERDERIAAGEPVPDLPYDPDSVVGSSKLTGAILIGFGLFPFGIFLSETL